MYDEASRLIQEGLARGAPPLLQEGFNKVREAVKLDFEFLDAWKLYCQMVFTGSRGKDQLPEEREWAQNDPAKLQFLDELLAGKHPLQKQSRSSPKESAETAFGEATRLRDEGQQDKAMEKLKLALQLDSDHLQANIAAAWAFSELEQWDSSVLHVNNALRLAKEPEDVQDAEQAAFTCYCGKANHLQSQERWPEAMVFFKKGVFLDLKHELAEAAFNRMWLLEAKPGCRDFFVETCKDALARRPEWGRVRFWLGRSLMNAMRFQEALPYLEEAVRRMPDEMNGHEWLFLAYTANRQFGNAKKEFEVLQRMNCGKVEEWSILVRDENGPPIDEAMFRRFFGSN